MKPNRLFQAAPNKISQSAAKYNLWTVLNIPNYSKTIQSCSNVLVYGCQLL